ncbi:MAG: phosphoribosylglycinamide formyltransferase [Bacteroidetes bacterium]|nr:phosphoribosylglycinamide formyltransferase [Bacteroidota bacterium]
MNICVFASGKGSNFLSILNSIKKKEISSEVVAFVSDRKGCGAELIAKENNIRTFSFSSSDLITSLKNLKVDFIVLAGFLKKLDENFISVFKDRIINIHPALLPSYGGAGMYGMNIHRAVIKNKEKYSGITIHFVNENYDEGKIIFQKRVDVDESDDENSLVEKIHKLEHECYPMIIKKFEEDKIKIINNEVQILN